VVKRRGTRVREPLVDRVFNVVNAFFLVLCALAVLYPLVYVVSASFSSPPAVVSGKVVLWPVQPSLIGYQTIFKYKLILTGYANSIFYTVFGTIVGVAVTFLAAYPLSRNGFHGKNLFMGLFVFTMLFSGGLIPTFLVVKAVGLVNTRGALIFPGAVSVWNIILMRTFLQHTIQQDLYDAAEIDGQGDGPIMWRIVIPLSGPIFAVVTLNFAVWIWNSYFQALVFLRNQELQPLQIILRQILILNQMNTIMFQDMDEYMRRKGLADVLRFSLIVVASAPLLMVYPFLQRYFVRGIMIGSIKG
jgi:putative aldouronate transport system permease protein